MSKPSQGARLLRFLSRSILAIFLFLNIILASHAWKFTHFYDEPALRTPQKTGFFSTLSFVLMGSKIAKRLNDSVPSASHTNVHLTTDDGVKLQAWSIPCSGTWFDSL